MAVTIKDIAREANVSIATVSKVLNNKMYVSATTKEAVLQAIERLNFTPNASACSLARKASKTIYYANSFYKSHAFQDPHMFEIISGITCEAARKGYRLSLLNLNVPNQTAESIIEECILSKQADGIILPSTYVTPQLERLFQKHEFPQLCVGKPQSNSLLSWMDTNHSLSAHLAVTHLLECGCQRLAFMGGLANEKIFMDRLEGFRGAMEREGIVVAQNHVVYNAPNIDEIFQNALTLLTATNRPDGIICTNSLMAVGTVNAIQHLQMKIPQQIKLVVFDNYPYCEIITPAPTVIDIDMYSLGTQAASALIKKIKNPTLLIQSHTASPELIRRGTT